MKYDFAVLHFVGLWPLRRLLRRNDLVAIGESANITRTL